MASSVGTPVSWRLGIGLVIVGLGTFTCLNTQMVGLRGQAGIGLICFFGLAALFSKNLRDVQFRTIAWGIALQFALAVGVLHNRQIREFFEVVGDGIQLLIQASNKGADFVFGSLSHVDGPSGFVFAFKALPPIIFVSSFFSVLYYLGVLQLVVQFFAWIMRYLMGTSGAETLSVAANVFIGQTEAPLIVKPFIPKMTQSELLALMGSGMAHISGGMMAVYISYGAEPVSILSTCVMACPCSLYLTKLVLPETEKPETIEGAKIEVKSPYVNVIDAAAGGVKDGLFLALNVAAMLIAFIAFIELFDLIMEACTPKNKVPLTLQKIFGWFFRPVAILLGVESEDSQKIGSLLGIKLAINEHMAYITMTKNPDFADLSERSKKLAVFALSGFANFASIGIQIGGIGAMAENRRSDLAKLGMKALFIGYLATLMNAAVAGLLMDS